MSSCWNRLTVKNHNLAKNVGIVLDEMYIKESTYLIINWLLWHGWSQQFAYGARARQKEWSFQTPAYKVRSGIHDQRTVHQFEVNNTNFPTTTSTGADLFLILHKVISQLTRLGLYIMTVTCDGARLLFSLHDQECLHQCRTSSFSYLIQAI